ncbi:glycosyltransferase [Tardiphaga sp.]|jgi:spore maturation protein CgeB|uniref:CgeB family protein n=1 Tax=Tardiphaga sp. TaxID=1926292 RepID=UPI0037DA5188
MKIVIFGMTISSSWGNGHATLWRGLCKSLIRMGHDVVFYEADRPYYAEMRDFAELEGGRLEIYPDWDSVRARAASDAADADVAMVTSYCEDSLEVGRLILEQSRALRVFYDLDTPVTLARLDAGEHVPYIDAASFGAFDLVLSYSGGRSLGVYRDRLGARRVAPLYGHVDPDLHRPQPAAAHYRCDLSYLGTYSDDRQQRLVELFVEPARSCPDRRFLLAGAQYPQEFPWAPNIYFVRHLPPAEHSTFFCSSRLTLNVTRGPMAEMGWCPSGRLFKAAACGVPLISDAWHGLDEFFKPAEQIIVAESTSDVIAALDLSDHELNAMAAHARERVLQNHSSRQRAAEMVALFEQPFAPRQVHHLIAEG